MKRILDVVAAVIVQDGRILAMQRGPGQNAATAFKWEFPGGKIEPSETPQQALERELREEMDYEVKAERLLTTVEYEYPDFTIRLQAWKCSAEDRKFVRKEHIDSRWLTPEELESYCIDWAPADLSTLKTLSKGASLRSILLDESSR